MEELQDRGGKDDTRDLSERVRATRFHLVLGLASLYIPVYTPQMTIAKARTFRSGNSEAVRLPREIAFGDDVELIAVRSGDVVTLYPAKLSLAEMARRLAELPAPSSIETRDSEELPERRGL